MKIRHGGTLKFNGHLTQEMADSQEGIPESKQQSKQQWIQSLSGVLGLRQSLVAEKLQILSDVLNAEGVAQALRVLLSIPNLRPGA